MAFALIFSPLIIAAIAAVFPSNRWRPWFLPVGSTVHLVMTITILAKPILNPANEWLALDAPGKVILLISSSLFFCCSFYCIGYLKQRQERSNRVFIFCLLLFPGVMSLVTLARHMGLMWVAIEATTLSTAPLIYFNHSKHSIEATWKYLLVGSVGIALALLGTFFLAYSAVPAGLDASMNLSELLRNSSLLSKPWLKAAFVLLLVGYGTKMGLAPMHTWKPDAYGESPGVIGAIFAGGITSCAFLAFLRVYSICISAGEGKFVSQLIIFIGLLSMMIAGLFMIGQRDFKRMLAYSSVEHMGILMIGLGIGGSALYGTILHVVANGMTKGVLFLSAGNIHRAYNSKNINQVSGAIRRLPFSGILFTVGFLAITGSPPFGPFISEFTIFNGAINAGHFLTASLLLVFLLIIFMGMGKTVLSVVQGNGPIGETIVNPYRDNFFTIAPIIILMFLVLMLGVYIPAPLNTLISEAANSLGGMK